MSLERDYQELQKLSYELSYHNQGFEKEASLLGFLGVLAAGEAAMSGLQHLGKSNNASLLRAGVELGASGKQMNPYTKTISKNVLGRKQIQPYEAGLEIGKRMKDMPPEKQERFVNKVVGMGSARKDRLLAENPKAKNNILDAIEGYQKGSDNHHPAINKFLQAKNKPLEANTTVDDLLANVATTPGVLLDSRSVIRPVLRGAENTPSIQKLTEKALPENTKRKKVYDIVRDYID